VNSELVATFFHAYTPTLGDIVVEVGAGAGSETSDLARMVGDTGLVVAVEAHPTSFGLLLERVSATNVVFVHAAASDRVGEAWVTDDGDLIREHVVGIPYPGAISVPAVTLDSVCVSYGHIDFLKMNIEGSEVSALRGATETLAKTTNVCVSCHDFLGMLTRTRVKQVLEDAGFTVFSRADAEDSCRADYLYGRRG